MRSMIITLFVIALWHPYSILAQSSTISNDAIALTLKEQSGILLDSSRALSLDSALQLVKLSMRLNPNAEYHYRGLTFNTVLVTFSSTSTLFVRSWFLGNPMTGNSRIDSLSRSLGLIAVTPLDTYKTSLGIVKYNVQLQFRTPLRSDRARSAYDSVGTSFSYFSGFSTTSRALSSSSLDHFRCNNTEHFIFGRGSGDCPSGCTNYRYFYGAVQQGDTGKVVTREQSYGWGDNFAPPYNIPQPFTIPYNFPQWYSVTQFGTADSLIKALKHPVWWVQNHAIQGLCRVFVSTKPIDLDNWNLNSERLAQLTAIRQGVLSRKAEIIQTLLSARNTAVCDVAKSIDTALARIATVGIREATLNNEEKITVSPNPFSDEVHIVVILPSHTFAKISIVNVLGIQVAMVFEGYHKGKVDVWWAASQLPSGVYMVQVFANGKMESCSRLVYGK